MHRLWWCPKPSSAVLGPRAHAIHFYLCYTSYTTSNAPHWLCSPWIKPITVRPPLVYLCHRPLDVMPSRIDHPSLPCVLSLSSPFQVLDLMASSWHSSPARHFNLNLDPACCLPPVWCLFLSTKQSFNIFPLQHQFLDQPTNCSTFVLLHQTDQTQLWTFMVFLITVHISPICMPTRRQMFDPPG